MGGQDYNLIIKLLSPPESRTRIGNLKYLESLRVLARNNRKNPTKSEDIFWRLLSYQRLNYKFTRQKPIGKFILDFYCSKLLLAIEIDGDSHDDKHYLDETRNQYLIQRGIKTLRYRNEKILSNLKKIKTELINQINLRSKEISSLPHFKGEN